MDTELEYWYLPIPAGRSLDFPLTRQVLSLDSESFLTVWSDLEGRKWVSLVNLQGFRVLYVGNHVGRLMNGCRRWILVEGSPILVVIAGPLIYLVYGCMYSSFSFSDFYQKSPHLLAVCAQSDIIRVTCTSLAVDKTSRVSESLDLTWQLL